MGSQLKLERVGLNLVKLQLAYSKSNPQYKDEFVAKLTIIQWEC